MTNAENDREAVEWLEEAIRRHEAVRMAVPGPVAPDLTEALAHERRILALAREALAMRERGVWAWCVEPDDDDDELLPPTERGGGGREAALRHRDEHHPGGRVYPLYAGEPEESSHG